MPPSFLIPLDPSTDAVQTLQGEGRHFITQREFQLWQTGKASIRPEGPADKSEKYKAPQHPTSHLLHSIPPRAPHRSSRSNILSYTLYLATNSRLSSYAAGSAALLHRAEAQDSLRDGEGTEEEAKSAGLRKLSLSLLLASRREGPLPVSLERRVALAGLTEDLLVSPRAEASSSTVSVVQSSAHVDSLVALSPLTSPDHETMLYDPAVAAARATSSIAQSLIDMKFSNTADGEIKPSPLLRDRTAESVFGAPSTSRSQYTAEPHMDYRIVRGQAMKSRAKEIFATSILPSEDMRWCRRHRVGACVVCTGDVEADKTAGRKARRNVPGQGLNGVGGDRKALVETIPSFLVFSAVLLKDLQERATLSDSSDLDSQYINTVPAAPTSSVDGTAAWYSLLHAFAIQACLEGYLVDGWTGTEGIEILFGCGCGVWEGKGWASRVAQSSASQSGKTAAPDMDVDSDGESDTSEEDEQAEKERIKEDEKRRLIESAQCLFGSRDEAQAEFERSMRDRLHEFLNVPEDQTLATHLRSLNAKYPLSSFEREMVDFLESSSKQLGRPALAKYETVVVPAGQIPCNDPDPYALSRYFARTEFAEPERPRGPHRAWEDQTPVLKRRRVD